jgi:hypothetical protein
VGGQPQRDRLGQRDITLLPAFGRGEDKAGLDDPHLTADVNDPAQEVNVVHAQAERLALAQPEPGSEVGQGPAPIRERSPDGGHSVSLPRLHPGAVGAGRLH